MFVDPGGAFYMVKFLPSYVGSKAYWVPRLERFRGAHFAEPFCGSAVLSANLAQSTTLNDSDSYIFLIMTCFDQLRCSDPFTIEDYERIRWTPDWWLWIYPLQKMSFSGCYRHSANGYSVPPKRTLREVNVSADLERAKARMRELNPELISCVDFFDLPQYFFNGRVIVLDPPYQGKRSHYQHGLDFARYWDWVKARRETCIVFDTAANLDAQFPGMPIETRKMRVNGKRAGDLEGMLVLNP